jgi:hypothetical protein
MSKINVAVIGGHRAAINIQISIIDCRFSAVARRGE